jgi:hypothetical protein
VRTTRGDEVAVPWSPCLTVRSCTIRECDVRNASATPNKEMKLTSVERTGRSQLISGVGPTLRSAERPHGRQMRARPWVASLTRSRSG